MVEFSRCDLFLRGRQPNSSDQNWCHRSHPGVQFARRCQASVSRHSVFESRNGRTPRNNRVSRWPLPNTRSRDSGKRASPPFRITSAVQGTQPGRGVVHLLGRAAGLHQRQFHNSFGTWLTANNSLPDQSKTKCGRVEAPRGLFHGACAGRPGGPVPAF